MICYKDKAYCTFYKECKMGHNCERALTPETRQKAHNWWGNKSAPICTFAKEPECMIKKDQGGQEK